MVIITDANGNIQAPTIPENVYQGSNLANEIVFLAPLSQSNSVVITFRKPNGVLVEELPMTPYTSVPSEYNLSAWRYVLEDAITDLYGQVSFQIKVRNGQGTTITSVAGTFPVLRGVPSIPSSEPSESKWQAILDYVANINADIENGWFEARGLLPYHEDFEYSIGATIYDVETNSFYTSLVDDNVGNPLSDTTKWGRTRLYSQSEIEDAINSAIAIHDASNRSHLDIQQSLKQYTNSAVANHNQSDEAHYDIRQLIQSNTNDITAIKEKIPAEASSSNKMADKKWVSDNYVPMSFASRLYLSKTGSSTADLVDAQPTPDNANTIVITSTNTTFDWNTPTLTITRTLGTAIQLNNTNSFAVDLYFDLSRNTELTFGAKIKVSTDNGATWTYISSNQSFGEKSYNNGYNSEDFVVYTDLASNETYPIGTLIAIELFKKQEHNSSLTTTYYCGVEVDGANVYSFVEFNFANTRINTNQIEDGAVTYDKLGQDVKNKINQIASKTIAGLVYMWEDEDGVHIWNIDPNEVHYTEEQNAQGGLTYNIKTMDYTETENLSGGLTIEIG